MPQKPFIIKENLMNIKNHKEEVRKCSKTNRKRIE